MASYAASPQDPVRPALGLGVWMRCLAMLLLSLAMGVLVLLTVGLMTPVQAPSGSYQSPVGEWRVQSVCEADTNQCRHEHRVYIVTTAGAGDGEFELSAQEVIAGKRVPAEKATCRYDAFGQLLCEIREGRLTLLLDFWKGQMHGTVQRLDGTVKRTITLTRVGAAPKPSMPSPAPDYGRFDGAQGASRSGNVRMTAVCRPDWLARPVVEGGSVYALRHI